MRSDNDCGEEKICPAVRERRLSLIPGSVIPLAVLSFSFSFSFSFSYSYSYSYSYSFSFSFSFSSRGLGREGKPDTVFEESIVEQESIFTRKDADGALKRGLASSTIKPSLEIS